MPDPTSLGQGIPPEPSSLGRGAPEQPSAICFTTGPREQPSTSCYNLAALQTWLTAQSVYKTGDSPVRAQAFSCLALFGAAWPFSFGLKRLCTPVAQVLPLSHNLLIRSCRSLTPDGDPCLTPTLRCASPLQTAPAPWNHTFFKI